MDVSDRIAPCTRMLSFSLIISKNPDRVFIIYSFMRRRVRNRSDDASARHLNEVYWMYTD